MCKHSCLSRETRQRPGLRLDGMHWKCDDSVLAGGDFLLVQQSNVQLQLFRIDFLLLIMIHSLWIDLHPSYPIRRIVATFAKGHRRQRSPGLNPLWSTWS